MTSVLPVAVSNLPGDHISVNMATTIQHDSINTKNNKPEIEGQEEAPLTTECFNCSSYLVKKDEELPKPNPNAEENKSSASSVRVACRICLMGKDDDPAYGNLINVCACKGSIGYLHFECLKDNLDRKYGKTKKTNFESQVNMKESSNKVRKTGTLNHKCEICSQQYQAVWNSKLVKRPISQYFEKKICFSISLFVCMFGFISFLTAFCLFIESPFFGEREEIQNINQSFLKVTRIPHQTRALSPYL